MSSSSKAVLRMSSNSIASLDAEEQKLKSMMISSMDWIK